LKVDHNHKIDQHDRKTEAEKKLTVGTSWLDPLIIVMALPTALAGIVWILFLTHTTLSVPALTGAMMHGGRDRQQHARATMKFHWAAITSLPPRIDGLARPLAIHLEPGVVCCIFTKANL
jgi:hypothetical protein